MRDAVERAARSGVGFLVLSFLAIALTSISWSMATPLAASPDEPAHLIKAAAVARGELVGAPTDQPATTLVRVPRTVGDAHQWTCFAFHAEVPASCQRPFHAGTQLVTRSTSAGLYDPVYYAVVGWPSLVATSSQSAVYGMRIVSALVVAALLALAVSALRTVVRPLALALGVLAALTPMVYFLAGSVNPNAFEVAAGAALLAGLLRVALGPEQVPPRRSLVLVGVSGVMLASARGISPFWMALIAVVVIVITPWPRLRLLLGLWSVRITIVVVGIGTGLAIGWLLSTGTLGSMGSFPGAGHVSPVRAFAVMLLTRTIDPGLIGIFGWLDTPAHPLVYAVFSALIIGVVVAALAVARRRRLAALLIAAAGLLLAPALIQAASVSRSGYIWQGRYALVALVVLVITASVVLSDSGIEVRGIAPVAVRVLLWTVAVLVVAAQALATLETLRRYSVGTIGGEFGFASGAWQPPGGSVLWVLATAVGAAALAGLLVAATPRATRAPLAPAGSASAATDSPGYPAAAS